MKYSNEACTTLAVGTAMTADGSRIYARSDDSTSKNAVNLAIYKDSENGPKEFKAIDSPFRCDLPSKRLGYSDAPDSRDTGAKPASTPQVWE